MNLGDVDIKNGVAYLTEESNDFSDLYVAVRDKEQRLLSDEQVLLLPYIKHKEWEFRVKSTERFTSYLSSKEPILNILDIGCGNGWFTNKMACVSDKNNIIGLDVNSEELEQGARVFKNKNLQFVYGNLFNLNTIFKERIDIITLNSCVQYFSDFPKLIAVLTSVLKPNGEIHIIDSPFYKNNQISDSKKRTLAYYSELGFPEMASHYFHHSKAQIATFKVLYTPKNKIINRLLNRKDSPFPWLRYTKTQNRIP